MAPLNTLLLVSTLALCYEYTINEVLSQLLPASLLL